MLVSLTELMKDATAKNYAVGAFNATNLESLTASIRAAEELGKPIILNHADVHSKFITLEEIAPIMVQRAEKASVPICLNLDHGSSIEMCMKAIRLGFTSVMLDASAASYEDNVRDTALVCRLAHSVGVTVEAELGHVGGAEGGADDGVEEMYTKPEEVKDFLARSEVDALAVAIGTAHGLYKVKPVLDINRLSEIYAVSD